MGMGEVVGKEFERIFSGLFGGGGGRVGVRSSNDSSSSAENGPAHSAPPAVVSKLDFSRVKDGGRGGAAGGGGAGGGGGGRAPHTSYSNTDHPRIQGETRTSGGVAKAPTNSHFAPTNLQPHTEAPVPSEPAGAPPLPPQEHAASSQRPSTVLTGETNTSASAPGMGKPAVPSGGGGGGGLVLSVKEAAAAIRWRSNVSMSMNALPVAIHTIPWPHGMPIHTIYTLASWHAHTHYTLASWHAHTHYTLASWHAHTHYTLASWHAHTHYTLASWHAHTHYTLASWHAHTHYTLASWHAHTH
jgi:hypothetical protein